MATRLSPPPPKKKKKKKNVIDKQKGAVIDNTNKHNRSTALDGQ